MGLKQKTIAFFLLLFSSLNTEARTLYVNDFDTILGNPQNELSLLNYALEHEIETLLFYDLHSIHASYDLTDNATNTILSNFIVEAKNNFNIQKIGAIGESYSFFNEIIQPYNESRTLSAEKIDIYNLEFEYWVDSQTQPNGYYCNNYLSPNGYPCNESGAFAFYIDLLDSLNTLINTSSSIVELESYLGWPTIGQVDTLVNYVDRIRLHAYVSDPNTAFSYSESRIEYFLAAQNNFNISIIFSSESQFMGNWLYNNSMLLAEQIYIQDFSQSSINWPQNINLLDFTYFTYTDQLEVTLATFSEEKKNPPSLSPNPVKNQLSIYNVENFDYIEIRNSQGILLSKQKLSKSTIQPIDLHFLNSGIYFVLLKSSIKNQSLKFIKE